MSCNRCSKCDKCCKAELCACPKPVLEIRRRDSDSLVLVFNDNGVSTEYDFDELIKDGQTDTSLSIDMVKRVLKLAAEKHIDSLTAEELGSILHLSDIGDVSTKGVASGSTLVYHKDSGCPSGCVGTSNQWRAWNALDNIVTSSSYLSVYDADGQPHALGTPANPDQYYNVAWNGSNKLSLHQFSEAASATPDSAGFYYRVYVDPITKAPYYVKEK